MDETAIDQLLGKIKTMAQGIMNDDLHIPGEATTAGMPALLEMYKNALNSFVQDTNCSKILETICKESETKNVQDVLASRTEADLKTLIAFAEQFLEKEDLQTAVQMFQFLTLVCPHNTPQPHTYFRLAETLSRLNIDAGLQMYDFVLTIFPNDPFLAASAAKYYEEGERPKRALRVLEEAKKICQQDNASPEYKKLLLTIEPQIAHLKEKIT